MQQQPTNTIFTSNNRGPPGPVSAMANAGAFEPPYQSKAATGKATQDFYSMFSSSSANITPLTRFASTTSPFLALGVYPGVNGDSCRNCLYTLAQVNPALSQCLRFEPETSTGAVIPVAARNTPECQQRVKSALQQCVANCAITL